MDGWNKNWLAVLVVLLVLAVIAVLAGYNLQVTREGMRLERGVSLKPFWADKAGALG